jgi:hypothetical protein
MAVTALVLRELADVPYAGARDTAGDDLVEELEDEIARLAAQLHAATQRLLALIARFDELRGWERTGQPDCARWLALWTGVDIHTAREQVRTARALAGLPLLSQAMGRGELSFSQARAVTRIATAANEADLLELECGASAAQLERMVRAWKRGSRQNEADQEAERHASRTLSVFPDEEGMYVVRGRLDAEAGALLMRAIEAASDALYRKKPTPGVDAQREAAQRRADALGLIAERALTARFGSEIDPGDQAAPLGGARAERYQVVLHVDPQTLTKDGEPGRSDLEDGTRVSAETSRRLACDASVVRVTHAVDGSVLDVGRKTRTVSPAIRRALGVRDRGCRFPGCGVRFTEAHHVRHWADGGETSLTNCLLLCRHHHRLVHEEGWHVEWWGSGRPAFTSPRGDVCFDGRWEPPKPGADGGRTASDGRPTLDPTPDGWTASASWQSEADVPDSVYFRASAAV